MRRSDDIFCVAVYVCYCPLLSRLLLLRQAQSIISPPLS